jgi:hypothetical protein
MSVKALGEIMKELVLGLLVLSSLSALASDIKKGDKVYYNYWGTERYGKVLDVLSSNEIKVKRLDHINSSTGKATGRVAISRTSKVTNDFIKGEEVTYRYEDSIGVHCREARVINSFENGKTLVILPARKRVGYYPYIFANTEELKKSCEDQLGNH